jgi:hypothetical protein
VTLAVTIVASDSRRVGFLRFIVILVTVWFLDVICLLVVNHSVVFFVILVYSCIVVLSLIFWSFEAISLSMVGLSAK